jgi:hypothetical protein
MLETQIGESLLSRPPQPFRRNDFMPDTEPSSRRETPVDGERATLERLGAAVMELYKAVSSALEGERELSWQYIERADLFLRSELSENEHARPPRGGLAPWQIKRVKIHIEANLDASIRVQGACGTRQAECFSLLPGISR